jgi:hypothetical protein
VTQLALQEVELAQLVQRVVELALQLEQRVQVLMLQRYQR